MRNVGPIQVILHTLSTNGWHYNILWRNACKYYGKFVWVGWKCWFDARNVLRIVDASPLYICFEEENQISACKWIWQKKLLILLTDRIGSSSSDKSTSNEGLVVEWDSLSHIFMSDRSGVSPSDSQNIKCIHMSRAMRKCVLCHMRTAKAQISLCIRAVW